VRTKTLEDIKEAALGLAQEKGLANITQKEVCMRAGIPFGSFAHVSGKKFRQLIRELKRENPDVISNFPYKNRVDPELRKQQILNASVELARHSGYDKITREEIAAKCGVSVGLVSRYLGTMPKLRRAILRAGVQNEVLEIVAQGLVNGESYAKNAPPDLKRKAGALISDY
jgi:AcrR family transcriptional regulator